MRPDISLAQLVDGELHARGLSPTAAARAIGVPDRTLRAQLSGRQLVPPIVALSLLRLLDSDAPWVNPAARSALVILGKAPDPKGPRSPLTPIDVKVDTVALTIEVWPERQPEVDDLLKATFTADIGSAKLKGYTGQGRTVAAGEPVGMAWWAPAHWMREVRWLRVQLAPWCPAHCRLLRRLLRLASTRTPTGLVERPPGVWVARFDVALDYAANPAWLILQRPQGERFRMVENEDGAVTWYAGTRGGEVYVRVYDCAERHNLPGPRTRIEAEVQPSPQVELRLLEAAVPSHDPHGRAPSRDGILQPFRNIGLGALHAPDLDFGESALLAQARIHGVPWTLAHLDGRNPADASRLRGALEKARQGPMLRSPSEWLDITWMYLVEALRDRLLFRVDDGDDGSHWSDPPWPCEDDFGPTMSAP